MKLDCSLFRFITSSRPIRASGSLCDVCDSSSCRRYYYTVGSIPTMHYILPSGMILSQPSAVKLNHMPSSVRVRYSSRNGLCFSLLLHDFGDAPAELSTPTSRGIIWKYIPPTELHIQHPFHGEPYPEPES